MGLTSSLLRDHEVILRAVQNLEVRVYEWRRSGRIADPAPLQRFIEFAKLFADRCHHAKEERCLFPCMERLGVRREGGPIGVMLAEHQILRSIVARLEEASRDYLREGTGFEAILELCTEYIYQVRQHIDKENYVLFPMGEQLSGETDRVGVNRCYEEVEAGEVGHTIHEKLVRLAEEI
jgi:Uncharacterized conserved protein